MEVVVTADFSDAIAGLGEMARGRLPTRELRELVILDQRAHAKARSGPAGAWAPRALSTVRKMRLAGIRRRPLGKLVARGAVSYRATRAGVIGIAKAPWAGVHNDPQGGRVGRGARVPGRPFLWLSRSLLAAGENLVVNVKLRAFGGR